MNFDEYQIKARVTAVYPNIGNNLWYPALGLGESGECQNFVKKVYRDHGGVPTADDKVKILKELGDQLWYISAMASELSVSLSSIAEANIAKLSRRAENGTIHGEGDNR
jgi:NTP pyrophosphatase (non-canonical NTP hydrolase)